MEQGFPQLQGPGRRAPRDAVLSRALAVDPWAAAAALAGRPGTLLLHTQRNWHGSGRSALLFAPRWILTARAGAPPVWRGQVPAPTPPSPLVERLPQLMGADWPPSSRQPVFAGIAGLLGYDLGPARAGTRGGPTPFAAPDAWLAAYDGALLFGGGRPPTLVAADLHPWVRPRIPLPLRWEQLADALLHASERASAGAGTERIRGARASGAATAAGLLATSPRLDEHWYRRAFARVREHLLAGDVYQVNLTGFVTFETACSPWQLFLHQARTNPVPFAAFLHMDEAIVTCHSPERLLRLRGCLAETAPIKGTAGAQAQAQLLASGKDRAEHVMIVDLARNDLGRSCRYGSIRVTQLMQPLHLAHLVHLVSRVHGVARPDRRHSLLADLFPGGSITGAPKRRAMEIIAQVERGGRGPYTGSIGYVDRAGHADWNIAIRTAVWQQGRVHFGCGGGVVLDSDCDRELAEAALKARSFSASLEASLPAPHAPARSGAERRP